MQKELKAIPPYVNFGDELIKKKIAQGLISNNVLAFLADEMIYFHYCSNSGSVSSLIVGVYEWDNCVLITNRRFIKIENRKVSSDVMLSDVASVSCVRNGMLRWDHAVVTKKVTKEVIYYGIWGLEACRFFVDAVLSSVNELVENEAAALRRPLHSGFLRKKGGLYPSWHRRFFRLLPGSFEYYEREVSDGETVKATGTCPLFESDRVVAVSQNPFVFSVATSARVWQFECTSDMEMRVWMQAFTHASRGNTNMKSRNSLCSGSKSGYDGASTNNDEGFSFSGHVHGYEYTYSFKSGDTRKMSQIDDKKAEPDTTLPLLSTSSASSTSSSSLSSSSSSLPSSSYPQLTPDTTASSSASSFSSPPPYFVQHSISSDDGSEKKERRRQYPTLKLCHIMHPSSEQSDIDFNLSVAHALDSATHILTSPAAIPMMYDFAHERACLDKADFIDKSSWR